MQGVQIGRVDDDLLDIGLAVAGIEGAMFFKDEAGPMGAEHMTQLLETLACDRDGTFGEIQPHAPGLIGELQEIKILQELAALIVKDQTEHGVWGVLGEPRLHIILAAGFLDFGQLIAELAFLKAGGAACQRGAGPLRTDEG